MPTDRLTKRIGSEKLELILRTEDYSFYQIEDPQDIEKFSIEGFEFFKGLGIIDYKRTFMAWLRKFPKPIFIIAVKGDTLISWVHIDEWRDGVAKDGNAINILRAIETLPKYRSKKIGYRLVFLALQHTVGYMVTKAISPKAMQFFSDIGFKYEKDFKNCPVDLKNLHGYMVLSLADKRTFMEQFTHKYLGNASELRTKRNKKNNVK